MKQTVFVGLLIPLHSSAVLCMSCTTDRKMSEKGEFPILGTMAPSPNIDTSRLQHAHGVYNEQTASNCGGQCLQTIPGK